MGRRNKLEDGDESLSLRIDGYRFSRSKPSQDYKKHQEQFREVWLAIYNDELLRKGCLVSSALIRTRVKFDMDIVRLYLKVLDKVGRIEIDGPKIKLGEKYIDKRPEEKPKCRSLAWGGAHFDIQKANHFDEKPMSELEPNNIVAFQLEKYNSVEAILAKINSIQAGRYYIETIEPSILYPALKRSDKISITGDEICMIL